jgi:hypothetical protein
VSAIRSDASCRTCGGPLEAHRELICESCTPLSLGEQMAAALEAVLLFHSSGPWNAARCAEWEELTGATECTSRALCDAVRAALRRYSGEEL